MIGIWKCRDSDGVTYLFQLFLEPRKPIFLWRSARAVEDEDGGHGGLVIQHCHTDMLTDLDRIVHGGGEIFF